MAIEDDYGCKDVITPILKSLRSLESIKILCVGSIEQRKRKIFKEIFEQVTKCSPESFHELKLYEMDLDSLLPKDIETFLASWTKRKP